MTSKIFAALAAVFALLVCFAGSAFATGQATPEDGSLLDLARPVYDAVMHGQWWLAAAGALVLVAAAARKYLAPRYPWASGPAGSALIVLVGSLGGAAVTALVAMGPGAVMSWALAWTALKVAIAAAGGYGLAKALVVDPLLKPWASKAPGWLQAPLKALIWAFDHIPVGDKEEPRKPVEDHRDAPTAAYERDPVPPPDRRDHRS